MLRKAPPGKKCACKAPPGVSMGVMKPIPRRPITDKNDINKIKATKSAKNANDKNNDDKNDLNKDKSIKVADTTLKSQEILQDTSQEKPTTTDTKKNMNRYRWILTRTPDSSSNPKRSSFLGGYIQGQRKK